MSEICVHITEFTDPACPWAYSAEPFRHRIDWLYEGRIEWEPRMVVLAASPRAAGREVHAGAARRRPPQDRAPST